MNNVLTLFFACGACIAILYSITSVDAQTTTSDIIFKSTFTGGSDSITSSSEGRYFHREKCKIHTTMTITSVYHNGHKRNNPDGTFYPGDSLEYEMGVRFEGCSAVKPCRADVVPNNGVPCPPLESICILRRQGCSHGGFTGFGGAGPSHEKGIAVIPSGIYGPDETYSVTKKSYAMVYYYGQTRHGAFSGYSPVSAIASFPVRVIDPNLDTSLSYDPLIDSEGYLAANLDGTYYVWDPVHVVLETDYLWKDERIGTIFITHKASHGILEPIYEFECQKILCTNTIEGLNGYDPKTLKYGYGGVSGVYNSTCVHGSTNKDAPPACIKYHGKHDITYESALYNITAGSGIRTGEARTYSVSTTTSPLVVQYFPEFSEPYPYLSLKDDASAEGNWSWSKRHVMVVEYLGSVGGGKDDPDKTLQKQRRALFNALDYEGKALLVGSEMEIDAMLDWSDTAGVSGKDDERCEEHDPNLLDKLLVFGRNKDSAMFVQSGYGRLYMTYPIAKFMQENNARTAVLENTVQTVDFAGQKIRDLLSYEYVYPAARFGIPSSLVMMDSEGLVEEGTVWTSILPVSSAKDVLSPKPHSDGLVYMHDHICRHVKENTEDVEYSNMVVSDMYPRIMDVRTNTGGRIDYILNRTGVIFNDVYRLAVDSTAKLDINLIYEAPSAYDFEYGVQDKDNSQTRAVTSTVTFATPLIEVANLDLDNTLEYTVSCEQCPHTTIQFQPNVAFGQVEGVEQNGNSVELLCSADEGCTVSALKGHDNNITLTNVWGGVARSNLFVPQIDATEGLDVDVYRILTIALVGIGALAVWRASKRILEHVKKMIGA